MAKESVANDAVVNALRIGLQKQGYQLSPKRPFGAQGVDVVAKKDGEMVVAEVIGYKSSGPARRSDFAVAFWAAIGRVDDYPDSKVVIALPSQFGRGLGARLDSHRSAWERIGRAFPELEIWLVDVLSQEYTRYSWMQLLHEL